MSEPESLDDLQDWIPAAEAARLIKSPRGRRTHLGVVYRMIGSGKLACRRRGRWRFVRRSEVLALLGPVEPVPAPPRLTGRPQSRASQRWAEMVRKRAGG